MLCSLLDRQSTNIKSEYLWNDGLVNFLSASLMYAGKVLFVKGSSYWQGTVVQAEFDISSLVLYSSLNSNDAAWLQTQLDPWNLTNFNN